MAAVVRDGLERVDGVARDCEGRMLQVVAVRVLGQGSLGVHEARLRPVRRVSEKESAEGAGGATSDGDERDPAAGTQERR